MLLSVSAHTSNQQQNIPNDTQTAREHRAGGNYWREKNGHGDGEMTALLRNNLIATE